MPGSEYHVVKGVCAQGSRPSTSQFVAWVDNGARRFPWTPYVEGVGLRVAVRLLVSLPPLIIQSLINSNPSPQTP